jgi:hypothetical protein
MPMFPITINGNTLDQSTRSTADAFKYILVQSRAPLSPLQRQNLENAGLKHLDYVSKNTYLGHYQDADLDKIRQMEPVVYADVYLQSLKITPRLKEVQLDQNYEVDITYHEGVDVSPGSSDLKRSIMDKSYLTSDDIGFFDHKARLTIKGRYLKDVAMLDDVRWIEEVGEVEEFSDVARDILRIDIQSQTGPPQPQTHEGRGR